jgi:hypothetical protein
MEPLVAIRTLPLRPIVRLLLVFLLLELFLFGGGRILNVGIVSLRMYFFVIALTVGLIYLFQLRRINSTFLILLLFSALLIAEGTIIGIMNGADLEKVFNDVKPLLSLFGILFFYFAIRSVQDVSLVVRLLKLSAQLLAFLYLLVFILINTRALPFAKFYALASPTEEFFFRGDFAFFYKGFFFLVVGTFFVANGKSLKERILLIILIVASLLTFTRGFILSVVLVFLLYLVVIRKKSIPLIIFLIALAVGGSSVWNFVEYKTKLNRSLSNSDRLIQIKEVSESVNPTSILIGKGFGIGVKSRPDHMEISYLEIFHKEGLFGLSFYGLILVLSFLLFKKACYAGNQKVATPFMLAIWFTFILSITNPFINNPIGINMVLISLVSLNVLSKPRDSMLGKVTPEIAKEF